MSLYDVCEGASKSADVALLVHVPHYHLSHQAHPPFSTKNFCEDGAHAKAQIHEQHTLGSLSSGVCTMNPESQTMDAVP